MSNQILNSCTEGHFLTVMTKMLTINTHEVAQRIFFNLFEVTRSIAQTPIREPAQTAAPASKLHQDIRPKARWLPANRRNKPANH